MNATARSSVTSWWEGLERRQRFGLVAGAVVIVVAAAVFAWLSFKPEYVPLTGNLSKDDTAAVVAQLEDIRARYHVDADTGAVLVPAAEVDSIRSELAQKGWPLKPAAGFELFDSGDFGMTEFTERINYQRALEGELARTIMSLETVRYARVHLVLPQSSLFKKADEAPKASVLLIGHHPGAISGAQIAGIQRMVASAVPELKPDNVSVHDQKGVELAGAGAGGGLSPGAVDASIRAESDVEDYLTAKAQDILARLFPQGGATVSVDVLLSRSQVSSVKDEVLPADQGSAAVAHIRSDTLPESAGNTLPHALKEASRSDSSSPQFDVEYRVGHVTEQSESPPGGIERLSVGVVIPDPSTQGMTADDVRDLVAAGIGINPRRGDRIAVYPVRVPGKVAAENSSPRPATAGEGKSETRPDDEHPHPYWVLLLGVVFFCAALAVWIGRPRPAGLSPAEREETLRQVREWLRQ